MRTLLAFTCVFFGTFTVTKCTSEDYVRTYQYLKNEISRIQLGKQKLSDKIALAEFSTFKGEYEGLFEAVRGELKSFTETLESTAGGEQNCAMSSGITARVVKREVDRCNQLSTRISRDRSLVAAFNKMKLEVGTLRPEFEYYVEKCRMELRDEYYDSQSPNMSRCLRRLVLEQKSTLNALQRKEGVIIVADSMTERADRCYRNVKDKMQNYHQVSPP